MNTKSEKREVRIEGRIEMHLLSGYSRISFQLGGRNEIDVKTQDIPEQLRSIGNKVLVVFTSGDQEHQLPGGRSVLDYNTVTIRAFQSESELGWFPPL